MLTTHALLLLLLLNLLHVLLLLLRAVLLLAPNGCLAAGIGSGRVSVQLTHLWLVK